MDFDTGLLHIESNEDGAVLRQRWSGRVNELKPGVVLDGYFAPLIERARAGGLIIEHRFEKLEYFNSAFISWVINHLRRTLGAQVKTVLYYEPASSMHRSSFEALQVLQSENPWLQVLQAKSAA
jgi:hypothetical protein